MQPSGSQPSTMPQNPGNGQGPAVDGPPQPDASANVPATPESLAMPTPSAWTDPSQAAQAAQPTTAGVPDTSAALTGLPNAAAAVPVMPAAADGPAPVSVAAGRPRKKKLLFVSIAAAAILLLAGGVVFGWYLPNTPDGVWKTSMSRTGDALGKLTQSLTAADKLKAYKSANMEGSIDVTTDDTTYSGTFQAAADENSTDGGLNVELKSNGQTVKVGADVLTEMAAGGIYPDVYFRLTGLSKLGLDGYFPKLSAYDNKWIFLSSDTLKELGGSYFATGEDGSSELNAKDVQELARVATEVTREYVFTTAADKAVFVKRSFVGKETTAEGVNAYRYKVGINSQHAEAYCIALSKAVLSTKAYQNLSGLSDDQVKEEQRTTADSCKTVTGDTVKSTDTYDMWIDSEYKLVHKIRVTDDSGRSYSDFGQVYKGGDKLSLFVTLHDGSSTKADGKLTMDVDLKTYDLDAKLAYKTTGQTSTAVKATLKITGSDKDVTITKPTPTVPAETFLQDVLGGLFGGL